MEGRLRVVVERTIKEKMERMVRIIKEIPGEREKYGQGDRVKRGEKGRNQAREGGGGDDVDAEAPAAPLPALIEIRGSSGTTDAGAFSRIKEKVSLKRHDVKDVAVRVTPKEAALITIRGEGCREKAKSLAKEIREVLGGDGTVSCSRRMVEVEVAGFYPSSTFTEIREAMVIAGGFPGDDVCLGSVRKTRVRKVPVACGQKSPETRQGL